jgi:hypothetical protein
VGDYAGEGAYKAVFSAGPDHVVKVGKESECHWGMIWFEWLVYRGAVEAGCEELFPATVWGETPGGTPYMVQELVECPNEDDTPYDSILDPEEWDHLTVEGHALGIGDLHEFNVGYAVADSWGVFNGRWGGTDADTICGKAWYSGEWQNPEDQPMVTPGKVEPLDPFKLDYMPF